MHTLISSYYSFIIAGMTLIALALMAYAFISKEQSARLNWAIFFSATYVVILLPLVHELCVYLGYWRFDDGRLPINLYFLWVVIWSVLPVYVLKGKRLLLVTLIVFWMDVLLMPLLDKANVLWLNSDWLKGELMLIGFVFVPSYYWAHCSYQKIRKGLRAILQIIVVGSILVVGLPFTLSLYGLLSLREININIWLTQVVVIIAFPSLVAVCDLVERGEGTPFPYDPTHRLVRSGVYAYIRNPIQWSFTFFFIPLCFIYNTYLLLNGVVVSVAYVIGVANRQEDQDMRDRFGDEWLHYASSVPKWRFLWRPTDMPRGQIYFDSDCTPCIQLMNWLINAEPINLDIKYSSSFPAGIIQWVTYVSHNGDEYTSVKAIAAALEHINLAYAVLGWFMRFPIINSVLQVIVNTMSFSTENQSCGIDDKKK